MAMSTASCGVFSNDISNSDADAVVTTVSETDTNTATDKETDATTDDTTAAQTTAAPKVTTKAAQNTTTTAAPQKAPVSSYAQRAQEILNTMTLEEKVGQMFICRCPSSNAVSDVATYHLGGYILFTRDFQNQTKSSAAANIQSYQNNAKIKMLIGVDEEGGGVNRVSAFTQFRAVPFWSPMDLYNNGGLSLVQSDTKEKAELLKSLGINMNFAPVCDLPDSSSDYIYYRTFGTNVNDTVSGVKTIVSQMVSSNMISVLKHFPGYGNNINTHTGVAYDKRTFEDFQNNDFLPFISGIKAGASCVLVSHNIVDCMDSKAPASLSSTVHKQLRNLGFSGVIITDDLSMDAITEYAGSSASAVLAVKAGNDLLCADNYKVQVPAVIKEVENGGISVSRINESVQRILELKLQYGIIK